MCSCLHVSSQMSIFSQCVELAVSVADKQMWIMKGYLAITEQVIYLYKLYVHVINGHGHIYMYMYILCMYIYMYMCT